MSLVSQLLDRTNELEQMMIKEKQIPTKKKNYKVIIQIKYTYKPVRECRLLFCSDIFHYMEKLTERTLEQRQSIENSHRIKHFWYGKMSKNNFLYFIYLFIYI